MENKVAPVPEIFFLYYAYVLSHSNSWDTIYKEKFDLALSAWKLGEPYCVGPCATKDGGFYF